jgi:hypothetical protein
MRRTKTAILWGSIFIVSLIFSVGCGKKQGHDTAAHQPPAAKKQLTSFVPPADSVISRAQMTAWFACNRPLDSLSEIFTASLAENKNALPDSAFNNFSRSQDRICVEKGLTGGYIEYKWILNNLGSAKNKPLYDSVIIINKK